MRIVIPHASIISEHGDVTRASLNDLIRAALAASAVRPSALEVYDAASQRFLLLRDRQIYAAAEANGGQLAPALIRDFLVGSAGLNFPRASIFELNTKLLHSFLVITQKKPALRVMTNLVDLDELLDKIEAEGKSCIVSATGGEFLAVLRYEKGKAAAFCHQHSMSTPREGSFRDEFLVRVYTQSASSPLTVSLYEDFLVAFAADAKNLPDTFHGRFEDVFLSKPPLALLRFKDREIGRWEMDRPQLKIGRTPDNDIVIDNLGVSRLHAVLEEDRGSYVIRDCESLNGTEVNGVRVTKRVLKDGDEVTIGKHNIVFRMQSAHAVAEAEIAGFDQTMVMSRNTLAPTPAHGVAPSRSGDATVTLKSNDAHATAVVAVVEAPHRSPRLVIQDENGQRTIEITGDSVTIGSDESADIRVYGRFVAGRHAEIVRENGRFMLRRIGGLRPVRVGGRVVKAVELKDCDEIQLANELIVYHE